MKLSFFFLAAALLVSLPACKTNKLVPMHSAEGGPLKGDGHKGSTFVPRQ